ncbi:MAG: hypothetical protein HQ509_11890 [Candidatus Marinimicrobia bacterium]|nr:hypothetical protein [Candidatus Neomarinimicrobiota bacterium]
MKIQLLSFSSLLIMSCSTMTFLPTEGTASKFNLATVEYVEAQNANQNEKLLDELTKNLDEVLNQVLAEDRAKISELEKLLTEQEKKIESISTLVDSSNSTLLMVSGSLRRELGEVKSSNQDLKMSLDNIKNNIDNLPKDAMEELNNALKAYLGKTQD